jgi:hypothetical protein
MDPRQFENQMRQAQRRAEAELKRQVDDYNRKVQQHNQEVTRNRQRAIDDYNRQVAEHNRSVERARRDQQRGVDQYNREADAHNKRLADARRREIEAVNSHNATVDAQKNKVINELGRRLDAATSLPRPVYTPSEQELADRVQNAVSQLQARECDVFLSYAKIDGAEVGEALRHALEALGVSVWFDEVEIQPGRSLGRQMDLALSKAGAGIALLTPAYLTGRFWTERELGVLLHKATLIPVLHGVTFADVAKYSGILHDLAGFETARDSAETIAQKITPAVMRERAA